MRMPSMAGATILGARIAGRKPKQGTYNQLANCCQLPHKKSLCRRCDKVCEQLSNGLIMSQTRNIAVVENLEGAPFEVGRCIGGLIQNRPHVTVALRRPADFLTQEAVLAGAACVPRLRASFFNIFKDRPGNSHLARKLGLSSPVSMNRSKASTTTPCSP